jgi:tetratricopeptide (TPR) repeat protein
VDVQGDLSEAVSGESSVSFGPLRVPLGALLAVVGHVLRGRHLTGSLHVEGVRATLTAQMQGGGDSRSWTISRTLPKSPTSESLTIPLDDMIRELAGRVHSDLRWGRATNWPASKSFTEGLEAYAQALVASDDRRTWLRRAEGRFIEASAKDPEFDLAYYNLGIVYRDLGRPNAADNAFLKALTASPSRLDAYYARAEIKNLDNESQDVIWLCDRVLAGHPHRLLAAQANNLRGLAERQLGGPERLQEAIRSRRAAVNSARRALAGAYVLHPEWVGVYRSVLALCSMNLGVAWAFEAYKSPRMRTQRRLYRRAEALVRQARRLAPADQNPYFEYAKIRWERKPDKKALEAFRTAAEIAVSDANIWSRLASALATFGRKDEARAACREVVRFLGRYSGELRTEICKRTVSALDAIGDDDESKRLTALPSFERELIERAGSDEAKRVLEEWLESGNLAGPWETAAVHIELSKLISRGDDAGERATRHLEQAITLLWADHIEEVRRLGLMGELARQQLRSGRLDQALAHAERALDLDPLSHFEASVLADILEELHDDARAQAMWRRALVDDPDDWRAHWMVGGLALRRAITCRDRDIALGMLREAVKQVELGLDLLDPTEGDDRADALRTLGAVHAVLGQHDAAIANFEVAHALQPDRLSLLDSLGQEYLSMDDYDEAESWFLEIVSNAHTQDRTTEGLDEVLEPDEDLSRGVLIARGYLGLAQTKLARGVGLDGALRLIWRARQCIRRMSAQGSHGRGLEAACALCEGSVLLELGRTEEALASLERSLSLEDAVDGYLRLASAWLAMAAENADEMVSRTYVRRAKSALRRSARGDTLGHLSAEIREVEQEIGAWEGARNAAAPGAGEAARVTAS